MVCQSLGPDSLREGVLGAGWLYIRGSVFVLTHMGLYMLYVTVETVEAGELLLPL